MPAPSTLTLPAGTWVTVRIDQPLSSDHNQPGDTFTATLAQPLVAEGRVVARRGQTAAGVVAEAQKAGRAKGTSRLVIELTELGLVDGRQATVKTRLTERRGDTSVGRDAGAIGTTTAIGAAIGAAAAGGFGAGMGAIAGAGASTIGVLATRGRATEVYPEMLLSFRLEAPLTISVDSNTADAYQPVNQEDYEPKARPAPALRRPAPAPAYYGGPYFSPWYYPYGYGYGFGPSFYFGYGGYYGRPYYGGYRGGGYHRGGHR